MRRYLLPFLLPFALGGCGGSIGIVPYGPGTYIASEMRSPALGGGAQARRVVLTEAAAFCQQQGRVFIPLDLRPGGDPFTPYYPTAFNATFRCGTASDLAATTPLIGIPP